MQPNAVPGDLRFVDKNQDGLLNDDDLTIIGNPFPDFTAGLNMDFTYGNWDMSMQWYGVFGNDIINYTNLFGYSALNDVNVRAGALDRVWREDNPGADFPRLSALDRNQNYQRPSDLLVEDGSFVRLKNLHTLYSPRLVKLEKLRLVPDGSITPSTTINGDLSLLKVVIPRIKIWGAAPGAPPWEIT